MPENPAVKLRVLSEEEATGVERPLGAAWTWSGAIRAVVSDSYKWRHYAENDPDLGPINFRIAQSALQNLYRCGFGLVKLERSPEETT